MWGTIEPARGGRADRLVGGVTVMVPFAVTKDVLGHGVVRLCVSGEIDNDVSETLATILTETVGHDGVTEVVVDLRNVSFLAAAGLHSLLQAHGAALRHGRVLRITGAHGIVQCVLEVTGLAPVFGTDRPANGGRRPPPD